MTPSFSSFAAQWACGGSGEDVLQLSSLLHNPGEMAGGEWTSGAGLWE